MPVADLLLEHYPAVRCVPESRLAADTAALSAIDVPAGAVLFRESEPCRGFPFVLDGQVRVVRGSAEGRELELYRVHPGEFCVVSTGCLFGSIPMTASGATVTAVRLVMIDRDTMMGWTEYPTFRASLIGLMADRMAELMALVEAVAFQRLDQRLARALLGRGRLVHTTHQRIADEIGTAREMVSRLLKRFEERGCVRLSREQVEIVDAAALRGIAGEG
jgi:CRP/FNR family transcriptional regulator